MTMSLPVTAKAGSGFNPKRKHPITGKVTPHTGVDFPCPVGTEVRAPLPGRVDKTGFDPPRSQGGTGAGRYLRLDHGLIDGHRIQTRYYHLSAVLVPAGDVDAGQVVALTGSTGDSTGPHLHFEVRVDGTPVDPIAWLTAHTQEDDMPLTPADLDAVQKRAHDAAVGVMRSEEFQQRLRAAVAAVVPDIVEAVLAAEVPEHPELTGAARRLGIAIRDTRIIARRIQDAV